MRATSSVPALLLGVVLVVALPSVGTAQNSDVSDASRAHYLEGQDAYNAGLYREAADAFRRAYALTPAPLLLYNVALAEWRSGNLPDARVAAVRALAGELPPTTHTKLQARVAGWDRLEVAASMLGAPMQTPGESVDTTEPPDDPSPTQQPVAVAVAERPRSSVLFWTGVATTVAGGGALGGAAYLAVDIANRAEGLEELPRADGEAVVADIRPRQSLGIGLLIGGSVATAAGLGMMLFGHTSEPPPADLAVVWTSHGPQVLLTLRGSFQGGRP